MTRAPLPPRDKKLTGLYAHRPEEMLTHAISLTLQAATVVAESKRGRALRSIVRDEALTRRASGLIMRAMLRQVLTPGAPDPRDLTRLTDELVALAREV